MATHIRTKPGSGLRWVVKRKRHDLLLTDFGLVNLKKGEELRDGTKDEEMVFHILGGTCSLEGEDFNHKKVGERDDVFDGKAAALYVPPRTRFVLRASSNLRAAVCQAPASAGGAVQVVRPRDVKVREVGKSNWFRRVHDVGMDNLDARVLLFGETFNPPGNWSSAPPHKHDVDAPPGESKLEELYYFRIRPEQGFGLIRVYTADGYDQVFVVGDGDVVTLPRGYHPVVAAPGYELYYFWVLAAFRERKLIPRDDPKHSWVKGKG